MIPTPALPTSKGGEVTAPLLKVTSRRPGSTIVVLGLRKIASSQELGQDMLLGVGNLPAVGLTSRARLNWRQPAIGPVSVITEQVRPERGLNQKVHDGVATALFFLRARKLAMEEIVEGTCTQAFHPGMDKAPEGGRLQEGRRTMFDFEEQ